MDQRCILKSRPPPVMLPFLPPETLAHILSLLSLPQLLLVAQVSTQLRAISKSPVLNPWRHPILTAIWNLQDCMIGAHGIPAPGWEEKPERTEERDLLARIGSSAFSHLVPSQNRLLLLQMAPRLFILAEMDMPYLTKKEWAEVCKARMLGSVFEKSRDVFTRLRTPVERGWKKSFVSELRKMQHRRVAGCSAEEAMTKFLVLHRHGDLTPNRIASRQFDPFQVMTALKLQNNIANRDCTIADLSVNWNRGRPHPDIGLKMIYALGPPTSFLVNSPAQKLLMECCGIKAGEDGFVPVGPAVIVASIHPSTFISSYENAPKDATSNNSWTSMCESDLHNILEDKGEWLKEAMRLGKRNSGSFLGLGY